jgi:hypothetical protein
VTDHDAILVAERNDVGNGSQRHEVKKVEDGGRGVKRAQTVSFTSAVKALNELEGDADPGEVLEGIGTSGLAGIKDGVCGRKMSRRLVMVGNNERQAEITPFLDLSGVGDAAVHGEDEFPAFGGECAETVGMKTIALLYAVGNIESETVGKLSQIGEEQGGSCHAVDVVIAEDEDRLSFPQGVEEEADGIFHTEHAERVVELVQGGGEEELRFRRCPDTPVRQYGGECDGDVETNREFANDIFRRSKNVPVSELHCVAIGFRQLYQEGSGESRIVLPALVGVYEVGYYTTCHERNHESEQGRSARFAGARGGGDGPYHYLRLPDERS